MPFWSKPIPQLRRKLPVGPQGVLGDKAIDERLPSDTWEEGVCLMMQGIKRAMPGSDWLVRLSDVLRSSRVSSPLPKETSTSCTTPR